MNKIKYARILMLVIAIIPENAFPVAQQDITPVEYKVKAAFLFNFVQFVAWPGNVFPEDQSPFSIGVLGEKNPFGNYLEEIVDGENTKGHPLVVQHFRRVEEVTACHILFVNISNAIQLKSILEHLKDQSILTVGEHTSFIRYGGMVRLFTLKGKVRIQVNPAAAKASGLIISSKLLRVADIVEPKG